MESSQDWAVPFLGELSQVRYRLPSWEVISFLMPCFFAQSQELTDFGDRRLVPWPKWGLALWCGLGSRALCGGRLKPDSCWDHTLAWLLALPHSPLESLPPINPIYENPCLNSASREPTPRRGLLEVLFGKNQITGWHPGYFLGPLGMLENKIVGGGRP